MGKRKTYSFDELKQRIFRYCSYQERCHQEVKHKLFELSATRDESDQLVTELITQGFLNEERFAKAFAGGKFRMKKWGRIRIVNELESRGLTANCIRAGLREITEEDYRQALTELLVKKSATLSEENPFTRNEKLANYVIQKGFEPELVWTEIKTHRF